MRGKSCCLCCPADGESMPQVAGSNDTHMSHRARHAEGGERALFLPTWFPPPRPCSCMRLISTATPTGAPCMTPCRATHQDQIKQVRPHLATSLVRRRGRTCYGHSSPGNSSSAAYKSGRTTTSARCPSDGSSIRPDFSSSRLRQSSSGLRHIASKEHWTPSA